VLVSCTEGSLLGEVRHFYAGEIVEGEFGEVLEEVRPVVYAFFGEGDRSSEG
jgi:hypothetical protein